MTHMRTSRQRMATQRRELVSSTSTGKRWRVACMLFIGLATSACGATAEGDATATGATSIQTPPAAPSPTTSMSEATVLTQQQLQEIQPNELGQVPILMYHHIGPESEQFVRTPEQLRGDL